VAGIDGDVVLSEDKGDGATLESIMVRNPFVGPRIPDEVARLID
jgi:predicted nucleic acid-binding protein